MEAPSKLRQDGTQDEVARASRLRIMNTNIDVMNGGMTEAWMSSVYIARE